MKKDITLGLTAKTAILTTALLSITLFAVGVGLYSFHQYKVTLSNITGPQLEQLLTATKLAQQSDAIISSSSWLLLATDQSERRRALFELSDRAEWMDKLTRELQAKSKTPESFREVIQAKENLVKNLYELDSLVEQRIILRGAVTSSTTSFTENKAQLTGIHQKLGTVMQKNKLYSTELAIAVGYHVAKIKDSIVNNASNVDSKMRERGEYLIASAILSITGVLIIAAYIQFFMVKRIIRLQHAVEGDRVLPEHIPIDGNDEITKLSLTLKRYVTNSINDEERILKINKELVYLADYDSLTRLYNRRHFDKLCSKLNNSSEQQYCVSIIDIDFFKSVNDRFGHKIGDIALQHIAALIKSGIRETDILARYGGEEFVLAMPNIGQDMAYSILERIRQRIESTPLLTTENTLHITASFGLATRTKPEDTIETCLRYADIALYASKNNGRNTITHYTEELTFPHEKSNA